MNAWNIAYLVITLIGLGVCLQIHGEPKTGNHNFFATLLTTALTFLLLIKGGYFS